MVTLGSEPIAEGRIMRKQILAIAFLLAVGIDASAQEFTGSIYGRIVDPTNAIARSRVEADGLFSSLQLQPVLKPVRHCGKGTVRLAQRRDTCGPQRIELTPPTASPRGGIADPGF